MPFEGLFGKNIPLMWQNNNSLKSKKIDEPLLKSGSYIERTALRNEPFQGSKQK